MAKFSCNFISYTLKRTVDITVVVPSVTIPESMGLGAKEGEKPNCKHARADKYPVMYLLHGFGNNHATWTGYTNVELYAEERNIAVVMISAENKSYVNLLEDYFYDFIENELPDFVCGMFPISEKAEDTFIAGLSMGGFGSLVHGLNNPEKFAAIGAFSPAVAINPAAILSGKEEMLNPKYDPSTIAKKQNDAGKKLPPIYLACGNEDFLYDSNVAFKDEILAMGQKLDWDMMEGYGHEWRFWDIQVEKYLDWIPRTDSYAQVGNRKI
jgi:Predicted esterase